MHGKNFYIGLVKDGQAYVTTLPIEINSEPTEFTADDMFVGHYPLKKLDVSAYEGKGIIISNNNGYHARVIEVLGDEVTQALKEITSEKDN